MKTSAWVNTIAWSLLLLNNLILLAMALIRHRTPEWPAIFLFIIPIIFLMLPTVFRTRNRIWEGWEAGTSLVLWLPMFLYCLQFWSPGQGG